MEKVAGLKQLCARKAGLVNEAVAMFEGAVRTSPTPTLQSLKQTAQDFKAQVQFEQVNVGAMKQVASMCANARQHYYGAMRALQGAQGTNRGAQLNNLIDGPGHRGGGPMRGEMVERMQQERRNQLMRQAQQALS